MAPVTNGTVITATKLGFKATGTLSDDRITTLQCALPDPYVVLVTGASSGIGEATARRLAREPNSRLILVARREDKLRGLAEEIGGATVIAADLTEPEAPNRIREEIEREHGALHLLVNNAGGAW